MKKLKLLFAAFAAMVSMGTSAQLTDGTVYWLQDASTGQFLSQGGNWGTQATLQDVGGVGFEAKYVSDGVFKLKNIMWNKVNNADLGLNIVEHDGYCDQNASDITLTASGDGYKLSAIKDSNPRYIVNNQSNNSYGVKGIGFTNDASEATIWKFLSKSEYDAAIQAYKDAKASSYATELGYTAANVSALETLINDENKFVSTVYTSSITNAALNAGNTDGWTSIQPNQRAKAFGSEKNTMAEAWNGCVVASQSVTGLPNGLYKVTFVGTFRPKGSTESGKLTSEQTSSPAYVFANDAKEEFIHWIDVSAKANNRTNVKNNATSYTSSFYTYVTDGTINLGVKQDTWYAGNMWCPFGYFTLTYYSDQVSDEAATALLATVPTATTMNTTTKSALDAAVSAFSSNKTIANYNALNTAITNANASIANYATAKAYLDKDATLDADGQASYDANETVAALQAAYNAGTFEALTDEQKTALDAAIIVAAKAQTTVGSDWTLALVNPSFENDWTGWNQWGMARQGNKSFGGVDGNIYVEKWQPDGSTFYVKQTVTLGAGVYQVSAKTLARAVASAKIYAGGVEAAIPVADQVNNSVVEFACDENAEVEFGFEGVGKGTGSSWLCVDDFHLTLVSKGLPDVTAVTGKMNADIAAAQTTAIETYEANRTVANYNAAQAAIANAQASADAYANLGVVIAKIDAALAAATTATVSSDDYAAIKTAYNNGTIDDANIMTNVINAYNVIIPVIKSQTAANADFTLAIQNQSFEYGDMTGWTASSSRWRR